MLPLTLQLPALPRFGRLLASACIGLSASAMIAGTLGEWTNGLPNNQRGPMDCPAGDAVSNLMKYALSVPPLQSAAAVLPKPVLVDLGNGSKAIGLIFTTNPQAAGIRYSLEASGNLANWVEVPSLMETISHNADGSLKVRLRELAPTTTQRRFARLRVDYLWSEGLIPAGIFTMGDTLDNDINALPTHSVTLGAFYLATTDATFEEWQAVQKWATTHGYTDLAGVGRGKNSDHPVVDVSWYDTVKWCNAKSEMEGLAPCYYTDNAQTTVYRTGEINITNAQVRWLGSGYRLPTEAEWEYAARGKLVGNRFPWGNTITQSQANYYSWPSTTMPYDLSTSGTYHPLYFVGTHPYTSPVRAFAPNLFSLYDMAGNVAQWCWDRDGAYPSSPQTAPKGADSGSSNRVFRGGSYASFSDAMRVAKRFSVSPNSSSLFMGFRWARSWTP